MKDEKRINYLFLVIIGILFIPILIMDEPSLLFLAFGWISTLYLLLFDNFLKSQGKEVKLRFLFIAGIFSTYYFDFESNLRHAFEIFSILMCIVVIFLYWRKHDVA
ncbi:MAG TPA: hypothetical protein PLY70_11110 [Saprospiraceae bacterium]|mgnify:FL=1|nr:hypothetical protein [Saprospiraceae bacterium]HPN69934.1 hypothetical protein [Saprospiraceae bacterium]